MVLVRYRHVAQAAGVALGTLSYGSPEETLVGPPFLPISPYLDRPADLRPPLEGEMRTDVAIVGGGLTGLSTALALRRAGVRVAVLEREFCGFGASGRNAGHLTPTIGKDLPTLLMMYGKERACRIVRFADHCVHRTEQLLHELGVGCDYTPSGNIMAVVHPKQEKRLRRAATVAEQVGARVRFVESGEMRARGIPPAFLCTIIGNSKPAVLLGCTTWESRRAGCRHAGHGGGRVPRSLPTAARPADRPLLGRLDPCRCIQRRVLL